MGLSPMLVLLFMNSPANKSSVLQILYFSYDYISSFDLTFLSTLTI